MSRAAVPLALALALSVALSSSVARAEGPLGLVLSADGALSCQPMQACGDGEPECPLGATCGVVDGGGGYCHFNDDSFLCCDSSGDGDADSDCTVIAAAGRRFDGVCLPVDGIAGVTGVCQYADAVADTFCHEEPATAEAWIVPCMTAPGHDGLPVVNWLDGDCDRDGVRNGKEWAEECSSCDPRSYPVEGVCVNGVASDAGTNPGPAGDAQELPMFRGSGGCTCRASGGALPDDGSFALYALVAVLWFRSSRRADRGP